MKCQTAFTSMMVITLCTSNEMPACIACYINKPLEWRRFNNSIPSIQFLRKWFNIQFGFDRKTNATNRIRLVTESGLPSGISKSGYLGGKYTHKVCDQSHANSNSRAYIAYVTNLDPGVYILVECIYISTM